VRACVRRSGEAKTVRETPPDGGHDGLPVTGTLQERAERLAGTIRLGGPVRDFERVGQAQLAVLLTQGLRPGSHVLDVGCGCLRAGYWLMHFLDPGCYFGIEPNEEVLQAGLDVIVEPDTLERAQPRFSSKADFDFSQFGTTFDFVLARSIWTHAAKAQIERMLTEFAATGAAGAVMMASYLPADRPAGLAARLPGVALRLPRRDYTGDSWVGLSHDSDRAGMVHHSFRWIHEACRQRGLTVRQLREAVVNGQHWLRIERVS
jgi:SAM-dependent methyltransferase